MNLAELLESALKTHGYDGLCHAGLDCGCKIGDLVPCDEHLPECVGGYLRTDKEGNWVIFPEKAKGT